MLLKIAYFGHDGF